MFQVYRSLSRPFVPMSLVRSLRNVARLSPKSIKSQSSETAKQSTIKNTNSRSPTESLHNGFKALGLLQPLVDGVFAQGLHTPTLVQSSVIPRLLAGENLVLSSNTGSGKTLAYTLPVINNLLVEEKGGYARLHKRPRCLVLVPTRELASQVLEEVKRLSHFAKVSSCGVLGGEAYSVQKKALAGKVDVVVASPGRLVQHEKQGNLELQEVSHIVIDEVDTMLTQGFGADIRYVLQKVFQARQAVHQRPARLMTGGAATSSQASALTSPRSSAPQLIMASATMTKAVRSLLQDVDGFSTDFADAKSGSAFVKPPQSALEHAAKRVTINIAEISGVHSPPDVPHRMIDTNGNDKLIVLDGIIQELYKKVSKTMIFCNTIDSCRAVAYFLDAQSTNKPCLSYHGEINSKDRARNLDIFRGEASVGHDALFMVCSDIAARGLDIQGVDHVLMFDFPLNSVDYLHRAGRTGRPGQGGKGRVTAIVAKRDRVLAHAIEAAIAQNKPLDTLTSNKKDYQDKGKLAAVVGKRDEEAYLFSKEVDRKNGGPRISVKRRSTKRLVSDPSRQGIQVKQPAQKTVSRTVAKRIAEINQKRGEQITRKRKKDFAEGSKKRSR